MNNLSVEEATQLPCQSPRCPGVAERGQNHTCPSQKTPTNLSLNFPFYPPNCCYQTTELAVGGCVREFSGDPLYAAMMNSTSDREPATDWCVFVCVCSPHPQIQNSRFYAPIKTHGQTGVVWDWGLALGTRTIKWFKKMEKWQIKPISYWLGPTSAVGVI